MKSLKFERNDNHFNSLDELYNAIDVHLDIRIKINGSEWYIGSPQGPRIIASGDFNHQFKSDDPNEVLNFVIDGKRIRDQWRDIEIVVM